MYLFQHGDDCFSLSTPNGSDQGSFTAMCIAVGDERIELSAAQCRLVDGQVRTYIPGMKYVFPCMFKLFPTAVSAENLFVLSGQIRSVDTVVSADRADAFRRRLYLYLLKKLRTPVSGGCPLRQDRSRR